MPEKTTEKAVEETGDKGKSKENSPQTMKIQHSTGEQELPLEKVVTLAAAALDLEARETALAQRESAVSQTEQALPEFGRLRKRLESDPLGLQALELVINDPQGVVNRYSKPDSDGDDGGDLDDRSQRRDTSSTELESLRRELGEIKSTIGNLRVEGQAEKAQGIARNELTQYPWLKGADGKLNAAGELAYEDMLHAMQRGGGMTASAAAAANRVKRALETADAKQVERQDERERLSLADISKATALATQEKPFTKEDLNNGRISKMAAQVAEKMGITRG